MVMRDRLLFGFLLLLFSAFPVFGQGGFTTVSGTITDPNGIPWADGSITAQFITPGGTAPTLNGQPFTSTTASGLLGPTGSFTMRLGDNGVIACPTSPCGTWQFTTSIAPGVLPPLGKGPQSFNVTTAINCGTNTPATCTSNAMTITAALTPVPALSFSTGSGSFATLAGGTNTSSAFVCGTGCSLTTSGTGTITPTPAGTTGQVQFNNSGVLGGLATLSALSATGNVIIGASASGRIITNDTAGGTTGVFVDFGSAGNLLRLGVGGGGTVSVPNGVLQAFTFGTSTNCSSSASPAVCGTSAAGSVVVAAAASTVQVNTSAVTANSQIFLARDDSLGTKLSVTCNTATAAGDIKISARSAATSFTITVQNAPATNPLCLSYFIVN
jgi:hypothetical protein